MEPWVENVLVPRTKLWSIALSHAAAHPLLGIGPGRFGATYAASLAPGRYDAGLSAHNLYLELASTSGAIGLGAFLLLIALVAWRLAAPLTSRAESPTPELVWAAAGLGVLAAHLSHGFFDSFLASHAVSLSLWMALAVCRPSGA
jgi:O-antigen ligase